MSDKTTLLQQVIGKSPKAKVLEYFLEWFDDDITISDIAEGADISRTTAYEVVEELVDLNIITSTRKVGQSQLYKLNKDNPIVKRLRQTLLEIVKET